MPPQSLAISPLDAHNQKLVGLVHPTDWRNPEPAPRYNLVVIGAGTAGLVTAAGAAGLGAKVALVERDLMGGDCLNFGCVPSKAIIAASRVVRTIRRGAEFGINVPGEVRVDFAAIMERMRRVRAELAANDAASRFRGLGVDVFIGDARFAGPDVVEVEGARLRFARAVIATGARATAPPIPGLADAGYLTNETVFSLTELPRRTVVIGAGPIGCELAQAFSRLGSEVTIVEMLPQVLGREDPDAAQIVAGALARDGIRIVLGCKIAGVTKRGEQKALAIEVNGSREEVVADEILVGAGRAPAVAGLSLESAGIEYDQQQGVKVNDYLQTTNPNIYAAGDAALPWKFTHVADATARIAIRNALFFGRAKTSALSIPWCTYTDPEIAHVGMYAHEAAARGVEMTTITQPLSSVDRAVLDGETEGFVRVHLRAGTDTIAGATIVASHASEMISELTTAMAAGVGLGRMAEVIHPYPTQAEAIRKVADAYNRTRLTPRVKRIFEALLAWRR